VAGRARAGGRTARGQHLLRPPWADRLVADAAIAPGELVVDLGAGCGALAGPLLARGARVWAVEVDGRMFDRLRRQHGAHRDVRIIAADARTLDWPRRPFRVVANLPFGGATAILRHLLGGGARALVRADVVLQWEAARSRASGGRLVAAQWAPWYELRLGRRLPAHAFVPPPAVDGGVLVVVRRPVPLVAPADRRAYTAWVADRFRRGHGHHRTSEAWARAWRRARA